MRLLKAAALLIMLFCLPLTVQAQGNHIILNGSSQYLDATTPTQTSYNGALFEGRLTSARLGYTTDQVIFDMTGWGTLTIKAVSAGTTNLEFNPSVADGTVSLNITSYTSGFMWRTIYDFKKLIYGLQVWDLRGLNTISGTAVTTNTSISLSNRTFRLGASLAGTLHCQMEIDFFRWISQISTTGGTGSIGEAYTPFPIYTPIGYHYNCADYRLETSLVNSGGSGTACDCPSLTATGSPTYAANSNTQPVAVGEDRTGQAKGTILLNGTLSHDFEQTLSDTLSINWACVSAPGAGCGALTIRNPALLSSFVDGATAAGSYTFSFTVTDGTLTHADASVTVAVVAVSANVGSDISCYVDEPCLIDASASTGYNTGTTASTVTDPNYRIGLLVEFGDGYSMAIPRSAHQYRTAGTKTVTVTVRDAQTTPTVATDTATITVSTRPIADSGNTEDLTDIGNANFVSAANCTGDAVGNMTKLNNAITIAKARNTVAQKIVIRANNGSGSRCVYQGQVVLKAPISTSQILVESSAVSLLPASHKRISAVDEANMPILRSVTNNSPTVRTDTAGTGAYYKLRGLQIESTAATQNEVMMLGEADIEDALNEISHDIIIQHCIVRPSNDATQDVKRSITLNSDKTTITDSIVGPNSFAGVQSQGIGSYSTSGIHTITNNWISAGSENILYGGAPARVEGLRTSDIEVRENYLYKNPAWRSSHPSWDGKSRVICNIYEHKSASRAAIIGNVLENNWPDGQAGHGIVMADAYDSGEWNQIYDIDFSYNLMRGSEMGITLRARDYDHRVDIQRFYLRHNLFEDLIYRALAVFNGPAELLVQHNTWIASSGPDRAVDLSGEPVAGGVIYEDSIAYHGTYGWFPDSTQGHSTVDAHLPGSVRRYSLAIGGSAGDYPASQGWQFPANQAAVNFTNAAGKIWSILPATTYSGDASDGTDPGVNWTNLQAKILHSVDGDWTGGGGGGPPGDVTTSSVRLYIQVLSIVLTFSFGGYFWMLQRRRIRKQYLSAPQRKRYYSVTGPDRRKKLSEESVNTFVREAQIREKVRRKDGN